jgi:predicted ATPase/DNA-binding XRE family transcriptional regulator
MATGRGPGEFAALLQRYRAAVGVSQEELAERAGLSRRGISDLERGQRRAPHPATVRQIAEALGLGIGERAALLASAHPETTSAAAALAFPVPLTSFIGREHEVAEVRSLLSHTRLLTLTGAGGMGKTRLALEAAGSSADIAFVDLAPQTDGRLIPATIAAALGIHGQARVSFLTLLTTSLASRDLLLILDNCEHLITACAELADQLLRACPRVRIIATSRQPLAVAGEQLWHVPPLSTGGPTESQGAATPEAVCLFAERARLVQHDFSLGDRNIEAVTEVCRRLDGIPLAIELAAAHVRVLGLEGLAARLDERLRLFSTKTHGVPVRQQTLQATIDWSYGLLGDADRMLFSRLGIFAGGWTVEAAQEVVAGEQLDLDEVLPGLLRLVDKSMVVAEPVDIGRVRYRLLETLRQDAVVRLAARAEVDRLGDRHSAYFIAVAEQAERARGGPDEIAWLEVLEQEHDNLRAALGWAISTGEAERGLRLAGALYGFWELRGHLTEGRRWLERLLPQVGSDRIALAAIRAKALRGAGVLAWQQGDYARAKVLHEENLALERDLGDRRGVALALSNLGVLAKDQGDYQRARALLEESLALERELSDRQGVALELNNLGVLAKDQGEYKRATALLEESLALGRDLGDMWLVALALNNLGLLAEDQGKYERATALLKECLALRRDLGDKRGMATGLEGLAAAAGAQNLPERAVRLFGASIALRESIQAPQDPSERVANSRILAGLRGHLGAEAFARAWEAGRRLTLQGAIAEALAVGQRIVAPLPDHGSDIPDGLTQ